MFKNSFSTSQKTRRIRCIKEPVIATEGNKQAYSETDSKETNPLFGQNKGLGHSSLLGCEAKYFPFVSKDHVIFIVKESIPRRIFKLQVFSIRFEGPCYLHRQGKYSKKNI